MNLFYKELPEIYKTYVNEDAINIVNQLRGLWKRSNSFDLFRVPKSVFLSPEGINRFLSYNQMVDVFRCPPNFIGGIHTDASYHAFNFILTNNGAMEWYDPSKLSKIHKSEWDTDMFDHMSNSAIEYTESNMMLVCTKTPHRIVNNSNVERICLSIRMTKDIQFNKVII
jgi:hypothetical protein